MLHDFMIQRHVIGVMDHQHQTRCPIEFAKRLLALCDIQQRLRAAANLPNVIFRAGPLSDEVVEQGPERHLITKGLLTERQLLHQGLNFTTRQTLTERSHEIAARLDEPINAGLVCWWLSNVGGFLSLLRPEELRIKALLDEAVIAGLHHQLERELSDTNGISGRMLPSTGAGLIGPLECHMRPS